MPRGALQCKARSCSINVVCPSARLSVRLSVTLVDCDHVRWNSSKIISRLVRAWGVHSLQTQTSWIYSKGSNRRFGPKVAHPLLIYLSVGDIRSQIVAEWLQIAQRSQWRAYRKPQSLFRMVPSLTPTTSSSSKWGPICPMIHEWPYILNE